MNVHVSKVVCELVTPGTVSYKSRSCRGQWHPQTKVTSLGCKFYLYVFERSKYKFPRQQSKASQSSLNYKYITVGRIWLANLMKTFVALVRPTLLLRLCTERAVPQLEIALLIYFSSKKQRLAPARGGVSQSQGRRRNYWNSARARGGRRSSLAVPRVTAEEEISVISPC